MALYIAIASSESSLGNPYDDEFSFNFFVSRIIYVSTFFKVLMMVSKLYSTPAFFNIESVYRSTA